MHHIRHACFAAAALSLGGCMSLPDYVNHGFKVGPEYETAKAEVASQWIDSADSRIGGRAADPSRWWSAFNDPALNDLIDQAYRQNVNLQEYGTRILQARAQLAITKGELFPQNQNVTGGYTREGGPSFPLSNNWNMGFNLAWELDFWGTYRRQVQSANAELEGSVENYDAVLVTLLADTAQYYITLRAAQERIALAKENAKLQRETLAIMQTRFSAGAVHALDVFQQQSTLAATEAAIPGLEIVLRQSQNQLCILQGIPPADLRGRLDERPIPAAPAAAGLGIPAELLQRRPDVRAAERAAAAQAEQIGIAQAEFYPHISINGTLGYSASTAGRLFSPGNFTSLAGPAFTWNVLNYGRVGSNVSLQDAKFQQALLDYRTAVLTANQEAEDALASFLRSQEQEKKFADGVVAAKKAYQIVISQYQAGAVDYTRLAQVQANLLMLQDAEAQARAAIATGLVQVYRALGGGWEIRLGQADSNGTPPRSGVI